MQLKYLHSGKIFVLLLLYSSKEVIEHTWLIRLRRLTGSLQWRFTHHPRRALLQWLFTCAGPLKGLLAQTQAVPFFNKFTALSFTYKQNFLCYSSFFITHHLPSQCSVLLMVLFVTKLPNCLQVINKLLLCSTGLIPELSSSLISHNARSLLAQRQPIM